ncbi:MAG: N-acetyltransferase [Planctomycetes bacterium]|nr:N-acetyltransferase [Planctomycetota bacterium]
MNDAAFGRPEEGRLVDTLRGAARPFVSLVACDGDDVVGHALFTPVTVGGAWTALALGPMAVVPARQRDGVGSALVRAGLDACRALGHEVVFVLGHPDYYPRFGFVPARPKGLTCKWPVPDDVFLVAELTPGALGGRVGRVEYHLAFDGAG